MTSPASRSVSRRRTRAAFAAGFAHLLLAQVACLHPISQKYDIPPAPKPAATERAAEPQPFWWGVSTSPYQIEGPPLVGGEASRSFKTDWDLLHEMGKLDATRDRRIDSFECFERDLAALKFLGVTHYRFGIEWARVEPAPGAFDEAAIKHYVMMARRLREEGITPVVCLWHFSLPDWLCNMVEDPDAHGWFHPDAPAAWERYVSRMAKALAPHVEWFAPQNEPNIYALAVSIGIFPPGKSLGKPYYEKLTQREAELFIRAAEIIRAERPGAKIVSVQNIIHWERDAFDLFGIWYDIALWHNYEHLDRVAATVDYIGFNYYQREVASPLALWAQSMRKGEHVSDLGWIIDPRGLEEEIVELARRYKKPMVIMENGIADAGDEKRQLYLLQHVQAVRRVREAGYDLRGYFHWSLMDNYEWTHGYQQKFGLFSVMPENSAPTVEFFAQPAANPQATSRLSDAAPAPSDRVEPLLVPKPSAKLYRFLIRNGLTNSSTSQPTDRQFETEPRPN
ncbi:Bifunctional beta-D-glucosidase/beta-D-fucosidase [Phycisphaerae bacterium RAS2]|nr:Bifunctional beta-D-glucosidase/beta-D-fucosidase [Phycisphaerae bacterium RAS2]